MEMVKYETCSQNKNNLEHSESQKEQYYWSFSKLHINLEEIPHALIINWMLHTTV